MSGSNDATTNTAEVRDHAGYVEAINRSQAVIEFTPDGTILAANDNFLNALGYTLEEIRGRHHRMFVESSETESPAYRHFWEKLGRGEYDVAEYKRIRKDGEAIWIQALYNPVFNDEGLVERVVKFATDITAQKKQQEKLQIMIEEVTHGADQIDVGSQQIASSSQSLASGASEQAASLEEISASLEELSSMTQQNADNAVQATTLSEEAQASATKGQSEMELMTSAMDQIKASSREISKIIKVIDESKGRLGKTGRLVIRPSGTEPVIRVMAEGDDAKLVGKVVNDIVDALKGAAA